MYAKCEDGALPGNSRLLRMHRPTGSNIFHRRLVKSLLCLAASTVLYPWMKTKEESGDAIIIFIYCVPSAGRRVSLCFQLTGGRKGGQPVQAAISVTATNAAVVGDGRISN